MAGAVAAIMAATLPAAGGGGSPVSTMFDVELFTGDGSGTRSIAGIDLSAGGLSGFKSRSAAQAPEVFYSPTGSSVQRVGFNSTAAATSAAAAFTASGTDLTDATANVNTRTYVNWTFKREAGFFDAVTYVGTGATPQAPDHILGVVPGLMLIKRTDTTSNWIAYHRDAGAGQIAVFNGTGTFSADLNAFANTSPSTTEFTVGASSATNASGGSFLALLFAHDPGGVIQAFTYTGNATGLGPEVSLPWAPQFIFIMGSSTRHAFDTTRTAGFTGNDASVIWTNTTAESGSVDLVQLTAGGFQAVGSGSLTNTDGRVYYGFAIRAP